MRGPGYLTVLRLRSKFCAALSPPRINLRLKGIHRPQFFVDLSVYGGPSFFSHLWTVRTSLSR